MLRNPLYFPVDCRQMHICKNDKQQDQHQYKQQYNNQAAVFFNKAHGSFHLIYRWGEPICKFFGWQLPVSHLSKSCQEH